MVCFYFVAQPRLRTQCFAHWTKLGFAFTARRLVGERLGAPVFYERFVFFGRSKPLPYSQEESVRITERSGVTLVPAVICSKSLAIFTILCYTNRRKTYEINQKKIEMLDCKKEKSYQRVITST